MSHLDMTKECDACGATFSFPRELASIMLGRPPVCDACTITPTQEDRTMRVVTMEFDEEQIRWLLLAVRQTRHKDQKNANRFGAELDPASPIADRVRVGNEVADILKQQASVEVPF